LEIIKKGKTLERESGTIPGFDEADAAREMAEQEELEENAKRAFKTLA
jgi:hypothetical protein